MVKVKFQKQHGCTAGTLEGIVPKGGADGIPPLMERTEKLLFVPGYGMVELTVDFPVACIEATVTDHLVVLFRDMPDKPCDEIHDRKGFRHIFIVLMAVIVEGDGTAVVPVNP